MTASPKFRDQVFPVGNPHPCQGGSTHRRGGRGKHAGESIGVWAGLEKPCFLFSWTEACILGGVAEGTGHRVGSAIRDPCARADRCDHRSSRELGRRMGTVCVGQGRECGGGADPHPSERGGH